MPRPARGFSLVEMAVVLTVLGVIIGIAYSNFGQSRSDADDIAAQQLARSTATVLESVYETRGAFVTGTTELAGLMPDRSFVSGATVAAFDVSVAASSQDLGVAVQSPSGQCFVIKVSDLVTSKTEATDKYNITDTALCSGATALITPSSAEAW